ncbi:MAG: acyl-CoA thioesterase [Myxococcota bacterium]|jgi:acyl-CoA thioester hydrolase|nr:acyl-CoA thioesterase [Myxococcota bacterium]
MSTLANSGPATSRIITRRLEVEVEFHHVDMMQVVHNSHYLRWFERGRMQILDEVIPIDWGIEHKIATPVVRNACDYLWPAVYGDLLMVTTRHRMLERYEGRFCFDHSIAHRRTKRELARGRTEVAVVDLQGHRLLREVPRELWERYQAL